MIPAWDECLFLFSEETFVPVKRKSVICRAPCLRKCCSYVHQTSFSYRPPLDVATAVDMHAWPLAPTKTCNAETTTKTCNAETKEKTLPRLNQTGKGFSFVFCIAAASLASLRSARSAARMIQLRTSCTRPGPPSEPSEARRARRLTSAMHSLKGTMQSNSSSAPLDVNGLANPIFTEPLPTATIVLGGGQHQK